MDKKALSPIVLPAIGVAGGGLAGLWATPERDTETTTAKMRKLLRCMALGGFTGIGADLMVRGGTGLANAMLSEKTGMYRKKIAKIQHIGRHLLRKEAEDKKNENEQENGFTGYGALGDYGAGTGIGTLAGLGLYGLLNDSKKRTGGGWLSAALTGAGLGAGGVGLYRNTSFDFFKGDKDKDKDKDKTPSLTEQVVNNICDIPGTLSKSQTGAADIINTTQDTAEQSRNVENNAFGTRFFRKETKEQNKELRGDNYEIREAVGYPKGSTKPKKSIGEQAADSVARTIYWAQGGINPDGNSYTTMINPNTGEKMYLPPDLDDPSFIYTAARKMNNTLEAVRSGLRTAKKYLF